MGGGVEGASEACCQRSHETGGTQATGDVRGVGDTVARREPQLERPEKMYWLAATLLQRPEKMYWLFSGLTKSALVL